MPQLVAAGITAAGIASGTTAMVLGYAIFTAGSLLLMNVLKPEDQGSGTYVNGRSAAGPHTIIYGRTRVSGLMTYMEATGSTNDYHHYMIPLAGHEVSDIGDIYLNDEVVTLDGSGNVTSADWLDSSGNPVIRIKKHLGATDQAADSDFLSETEDSAVDSNFRGRGIAYLYVRVKYDQDVFAQGIPSVSAVVYGRKCYDPRTSSYTWTDNAALCLLDYVTQDWGLAEGLSDVDLTAWAAEANICDETVSTPGGNRSRYVINGSFTRDQAANSVIPKMLTACAGTFFYSGGFLLKTGYYATPSLDLDEGDFRSGVKLMPRVSIQDNFNQVQAVYQNEGADYIDADLPVVKSSTFLAEDNGNKVTRDLALDFTTNADDGVRLATILLHRTREGVTCTARFGPKALKARIGDTVRLTFSRYGWSQKTFEVINTGIAALPKDGLVVELTLQETSADLYDPSTSEIALTANNATFDPISLPAVSTSDITLTAYPYFNDGGYGSADLGIEVDVARLGIRGYECRYRVDAAADWQYLGRSDTGYFALSDIASRRAAYDGAHTEYIDVQCRAYNRLGQAGAWSGSVNYEPTPRDRQPVANLSELDDDVIDYIDAAKAAAIAASEEVDARVDAANQEILGANYELEVRRLQEAENALKDYQGDVANRASITQEQNTRLAEDEALAALIAAVDAGLTTAEGDIAANATGLTTLEGRVTTAEGNITANASDITSLQASLSTAEGTITANSGAITALDARVTTAEGDITANASDISGLQADLTTAEGNISGNTSAITSLDTRVTAAEGGVATNTSDITSLDGRLTTAEGDVLANAGAITTLQASLSTAEGNITANASDITSLQTDLGTAQTDIVANAGAITTLDTRVTSAEGDITAQASDISTLQTTVGGNTADISTNATAISDLDTAIGDYVIRVNTGGASALFEIWAITDLAAGSAQSGIKLSADYFEVDSDLSLFGGVVASDNYAEDGSGNPTAGWALDGPNDQIKAVSVSAVFATLGTFKSAASGERTEISEDVIKVYDSSGTKRVQIGDLTA